MLKKWFKFWKFILAPVFKSHNSALSKLIGNTARNIYFQYENNNFDQFKNGEVNVLKTINSALTLKTVFDVGANHGEWTKAVKDFTDKAVEVHCFEVVPQTYNKLKENLSSYKDIVLNNIGLSDKKEKFTIYYNPEHSGTATALDPVFYDKKDSGIIAHSITGDEYVKENSIDQINFLKIDVEGMEPKVLEGFKETLKSGKIDIIQFEYGLVNIQSRFLLEDAYNLLEPLGYKIGRIYPNLVKFKPYMYYDERFIGGNYLAVKKELKEVLNVLS